MNKKIIIAGAGALVLAAASFLLLYRPDAVERQFQARRRNPVQTPVINQSVLDSIKMESIGEGAMVRSGELSLEQIVALLRKKYGKNIGNAWVQTRMLEELMRYLKAKYPDTWVDRLQEILAAAFPDLAAKLFNRSEQLYRYEKAFRENQEKLAGMTPDQRRQFLSDLRQGIFGGDAKDIWAASERSGAVGATLRQIAGDKNMDLQQKLDAYHQSIKKAYGEGFDRQLELRRQEYTNAFLSAVQEDLAKLDDSGRLSVYRSLWKQMGYSPDAADRLEALEKERNRRWSDGEAYSTRRKEILGRYTGEEREQKLDALRRELFGAEAETIRDEENAGFFRYERKRTHGRN